VKQVLQVLGLVLQVLGLLQVLGQVLGLGLGLGRGWGWWWGGGGWGGVWGGGGGLLGGGGGGGAFYAYHCSPTHKTSFLPIPGNPGASEIYTLNDTGTTPEGKER